MSKHLLLNGTFHNEDTPLVTASCRGFRYGDGLFETLRVKDNAIQLQDYHLERLWTGLQSLCFELPTHFTPAFISSEILRICKKNHHENLARVRLQVFRGEGGINDPVSDIPNYIIQTWSFNPALQQLNNNGLIVDIYPHGRKAIDAFSPLKTNNYLLYLMAARWAKDHQLNESLVLNVYNRIADASIANVFYVKDGKLYTPATTEGGIDGVMRRFILANARQWNIQATETLITLADLQSADEILLTNAISGVRWVKQLGETTYTNSVATQLYALLQRHIK